MKVPSVRVRPYTSNLKGIPRPLTKRVESREVRGQTLDNVKFLQFYNRSMF